MGVQRSIVGGVHQKFEEKELGMLQCQQKVPTN